MVEEISIVVKGDLERLPPVITVAQATAGLGIKTTVFCSSSSKLTKLMLSGSGVSVRDLCPSAATAKGLLGRLHHWRQFSKEYWKVASKNSGSVMQWIASADTALALGSRLLGEKYIVEFFELHEDSPVYRRCLPAIARNARCVVVNDEFRAAIVRVWCKLDATPFVLPNKPLVSLQPPKVALVEEQLARLEEACQGRRIVLYQGHICPGRELTPIAAAVSQRSDLQFVLMGLDNHGIVDQLRAICPRTTHVSHLPPPQHLLITRRAHIGIVAYDYDRLNSIFCAPNKIWEYASVGVPMLCRDVPSLRYSIGAAGAGICVPFENGDEVAAGLTQIDQSRETYSKRALEFFDSFDLRDGVKRILLNSSVQLPHGEKDAIGKEEHDATRASGICGGRAA